MSIENKKNKNKKEMKIPWILLGEINATRKLTRICIFM